MRYIIIFLLTITALMAEASLYVGTSYGYYSQSFNDVDADSSSSVAKLKIAYGDMQTYGAELSLEYAQNESSIFSDNDGAKIGFNLELVKAFVFDIPAYPFYKVGLGAGYLDIDRASQTKLNYGSFNLGVGAFIPISKSIDIEVGYDYRYITYETVDMIESEIAYKSQLSVVYVGINTRF